jgi:pimeloyl-ACP methyl ester carboxylesterase
MPDLQIELCGTSTAVNIRPGQSPALLCVHGNSLSRRIFEPLYTAPALAKHCIISYDLPGHGCSGRPADPDRAYTIAGYCAHLAALIDHLGQTRAGFDRVLLLGFSLGGHIAIQALASPLLSERTPVAGLVTIGAPPLAGTGDFPQAFQAHPDGLSLFQTGIEPAAAALIAGRISADHQLQGGITADILNTDPAARTILFRSLGTQPFQDECAFIRTWQKTRRLYFGAAEQLVNLAYLTAKGLPQQLGSDLVLVHGQSHLPDLGAADFCAHLAALLDSC